MDISQFYENEVVNLITCLDEEAVLLEFVSDFAELDQSNVQVPRVMYDRPYSGNLYIHEILNGHDVRAYNYFRMPAQAFIGLRDLLMYCGVLRDTRFMPATEQLTVFLRVIAQADSYRSVCEFFQHSLETVSRNFRQVL
ncbi:hypothetical protein AXF42_Ash020315 [Apostasia shenzhenica]|uniref:DUF8040 domain-containing protein n=1 Tax=Apostasia shenzhenica TaxID=1088818 RepID=A0A2I0B0N7_9ASPA|nr:hypothetical protein AXF42_Ash020315 [Apostasia shenzhenica]